MRPIHRDLECLDAFRVRNTATRCHCTIQHLSCDMGAWTSLQAYPPNPRSRQWQGRESVSNTQVLTSNQVDKPPLKLHLASLTPSMGSLIIRLTPSGSLTRAAATSKATSSGRHSANLSLAARSVAIHDSGRSSGSRASTKARTRSSVAVSGSSLMARLSGLMPPSNDPIPAMIPALACSPANVHQARPSSVETTPVRPGRTHLNDERSLLEAGAGP